jgi:hypothetical protein
MNESLVALSSLANSEKVNGEVSQLEENGQVPAGLPRQETALET